MMRFDLERATRILTIAGVLMVAGLAARWMSDHPGREAVVETQGLPGPMRGRYGVLVVMQPEDCTGSRNFLDAIAALERDWHVPVVGVPVHAPSDKDELRLALAGLDPEYPLAPALAGEATTLITRLGYHHTPMAVVLDPRGRARLVVLPDPVPYRQAELTRLVGSYIAAIQPGGNPR